MKTLMTGGQGKSGKSGKIDIVKSGILDEMDGWPLPLVS
jgi:hypothetical protein